MHGGGHHSFVRPNGKFRIGKRITNAMHVGKCEGR